ncbi:MAG: asparagine synthase-related protein [Croceibacterium sp.]
MIGLARFWRPPGWADPTRIAASLGMFAGAASNAEISGDVALFAMDGPRALPRRGWRAHRSQYGLPVLFCGWLNDKADLAAQYGCAADPAAIYAAAFERHGDRADSVLDGNYATLIPLPGGRIRMARSPMGGMPLFYAADATCAVVCSIPRPILAAGWPQTLRTNPVLQALALEVDSDPWGSMFEGIRQLPDGAIGYLTPDGLTCSQWHDITALPETRFKRDEEYVEAANALLARSVRNALGDCQKPGLTISGGLDSSIMADEVMRQLPAGQRIPAFSFHPLDQWQGKPPPTTFADERPYVRAFAAMHPQMDLRLTDNAGIAHDFKARELFLAGGSASPSLTVATPHFGIRQMAAQEGCDCLFNAGTGNMAFSNSPPWAYPELLRTGQWRALWQLAAARPDDDRSVPRRILAHALMPLIPAALADRLRALVHGGTGREPLARSLLRADFVTAGTAPITGEGPPASRAHWLRQIKPHMGTGAEQIHALEQVFGIRTRDIAQDRRLLEFCFTIPTDQFVRRGMDRWLARRMAVGRMPEAQRLNRRYGRQNVDWFHRLTPRLDDMRRDLRHIADQPELADHVDVDRALATLDDWPTSDDEFARRENDLRFVLPSTILMSKYVDFVTGRNSG